VSRYAVNVLLYRLKKDREFRMRFDDDRAAALAGADLTDAERRAFVEWDLRRLNELGGSLHLLLSIPLKLGGPEMAPPTPQRSPGAG
jgi:aromatic-ring opening dioxygenase LigAB LigA subunit